MNSYIVQFELHFINYDIYHASHKEIIQHLLYIYHRHEQGSPNLWQELPFFVMNIYHTRPDHKNDSDAYSKWMRTQLYTRNNGLYHSLVSNMMDELSLSLLVLGT